MESRNRKDPDRDVVRRCQECCPEGPEALEGPFRQLYDLYKDRVYNVCYRITGSATDALDASQETFGIVFRKLASFRFESKFSSWVYRIAVNASIDLKRRSSSQRLASLEAATGEDRLRSATRLDVLRDERTEQPSMAASRRELEEEIQRAILRLSPKLQAITVLRYVEILSYDEIAETLQISLGTVKSRLARAHDALDRELTPVLDRHYTG